MKIDYLFDIVCPWCYVGKRKFDILKLHKKKNYKINWLPYFLNPDMRLNGIDRKAYLSNKFGGKTNADQVYDRIFLEGKKVGINFKFDKIKIMPNSLNAMYVISLIKDHDTASQFIDILFKSFFINGENIGDNNILFKYASIYIKDFSANDLNNNKCKKKLLLKDKEHKLKGVSAVPLIIINDKYFISGAQDTNYLEKFINEI